MKIAIVNNDDFSVLHFRKELILTLISLGHEVTVIVPVGKYNKGLLDLGVSVININVSRFIAIFSDLIYTIHLYKIFVKNDFDIVHNMTIKPNIFGSVSARFAKVNRIVSLVAGIGYIFSDHTTVRMRIVRELVIVLYRFAFSFNDKVWFQNQDDINDFVSLKILSRSKALLIKSSGVNMDKYNIDIIGKNNLDLLRKELRVPSDFKCVVMVAARMIRSKGVNEFLSSATLLSRKYHDWCFIMLTPREDTPDSVPQEFIDQHISSNIIVIDKFRDDSINFLAIADVVVLPSYYREGVPRTLLEAMSLSKPIITTSERGCKEVVVDGVNGYKIQSKSTDELAIKIELLINSRKDRVEFGKESRNIVGKYYRSSIIIDRVISELYDL